MSEIKSLFSISHDHFHGLMIVQMIKKNDSGFNETPFTTEDKANYTIHFYKMELENHFYIEEHALQPLVRGISKEIDETFDKVIEQHITLKDLISNLKDTSSKEEPLNKFANALEEHIKLEERVLFPMIKKELSRDELLKLAENLKKNGYEDIYK